MGQPIRRHPILVPWSHVRYVSERRFIWPRAHELELGSTAVRVKEEDSRPIEPFLLAGQRPVLGASTASSD